MGPTGTQGIGITKVLCRQFVLLVFLISFLFVNFFLITEEDDLTVFEKFGARHFGVRLGPHSLAQIKSGGPSSVAAGQNVAPQKEQRKAQKDEKKAEEFEMKEHRTNVF
uniref:Uncharacterized protein n=1 Tax=Globodera pallida TaxID=36090 RepID=A0A183BKC2_GLOPA